MDDIIISMLQLAQALSQNDVLVINVPDQSSETGFATRKTTTDALFLYFLTQVLFTSALQTDVKTITGAINEVKTAAGSAVSTADDAAAAVSDLTSDVEALELHEYIREGDSVDLADVLINGYIEDGIYKLFIPLRRPLVTGIEPTITGDWNVRGATEHSTVALEDLGTVTIQVQDAGLVVSILSQEAEEGLVQFESIDGEITFTEEE